MNTTQHATVPTIDRSDVVQRAHIGGDLVLPDWAGDLPSGARAIGELRADVSLAQAAFDAAVSSGSYANWSTEDVVQESVQFGEYLAAGVDLLALDPGAVLACSAAYWSACNVPVRADYDASGDAALSHSVFMPHRDGGYFRADLRLPLGGGGMPISCSTMLDYAWGDIRARQWVRTHTPHEEFEMHVAIRDWVLTARTVAA